VGFLDRLVSIALPRVRDFKGVSPARLRRPRQLHARLRDQLLFPENRLP
jgi:ribosomal protein L5